MKFDKSPQWLVQLFDALQPEVGGSRRLMFGYPCAFENGHLATGLFGDGLFVKVSEQDRAELTRKGAVPLAPMGRPSKQMLVLPQPMLEDEELVKEWMRRAIAHAQSLPPKKPAAKKRKPAAKKKR